MELGLIDTHAHLDDTSFDVDREELLVALGEGMSAVITQGIDADTSAFAVALAEQHPFIYAAVGYHPGDVAKIKDDSYLEQLAQWAKHPKVVAIGEIGLDYYWEENEPREIQLNRLHQQVKLAQAMNLPVIMHDREAHGDTLSFLQATKNLRGVMHCYSGSVEMAKELWKRGIYLGFGGTSTFKNSQKTKEVLAACPEELILFETDCPYLTPVPYRGKRNNPLYTEYVVRNAAEIRGCSYEEMLAIGYRNAHTLFDKLDK